jgi:predicted nuclease with TOPRIM domain
MPDEKTNQSINGYFTKQTIACRLSEDTVALIDENYEMITGDIKPVTDRKLIENMLDMALSKVKPNIEDKKLIEQLQDKVTTLSNDNNNMKSQLQTLSTQHEQELAELNSQLSKTAGSNDSEFQRLQAVISSQRSRINELENTVNSFPGLVDNKYLLSFPEKEQQVVDHVCEAESNATGENVSPALLLKKVFFYTIINGPYDVFKSNFSHNTLMKILRNKPPES